MTHWAEWDPDDPAVARMRAALELEPVEVAPEPTPAPIAAPDESSARIAALYQRATAGDASAMDELRRTPLK